MPLTINTEERLAIYRQLQVDLGAFVDLSRAFSRGDYEQADVIAIALCDDLAFLVVDLIWGEEKPREPIKLMTSVDVLRRVFTRFLYQVEKTPQRMTPTHLDPEDARQHLVVIERVTRRVLHELAEPVISAEESRAVSAALLIDARDAFDALSRAIREGDVEEANRLANLISGSLRLAVEDLGRGDEPGDVKLTAAPDVLRSIFGRLFGLAFSEPRSLEKEGASAKQDDSQALLVQQAATRVLDALGHEADPADGEALA